MGEKRVGNSFQLKSQVVGPGSVATFLARHVSCDEHGISCEGEIQEMMDVWRLERDQELDVKSAMAQDRPDRSASKGVRV